jgi:AraC family transcriptional regulator
MQQHEYDIMNPHLAPSGKTYRGTPPYLAVSRSLSRLPHATCDEETDARQSSAGQADVYPCGRMVEIYPSAAVTRRALSWMGMAVETVTAKEHRRIDVRFQRPAHLLILFEGGSRKDGSTSIEGLPRSGLRNYGNKLVFVPAGHRHDDWQEPSHPGRATYFYFDTAGPSDFLAGLDQASLAPRLFFEDAGLRDIAVRLKALVEATEPIDRAYCESLGVVLAHELARACCAGTPTDAPARGGLAGWQQRAVAKYIEEHVADSIPLGTIAEIAGLSPFHFSRAFKQSFGIPPHRYHVQRRIERAKSLLADPAASITEVGMAVGFSETSSFSTAFRKTTGISPTSFQRSA